MKKHFSTYALLILLVTGTGMMVSCSKEHESIIEPSSEVNPNPNVKDKSKMLLGAWKYTEGTDWEKLTFKANGTLETEGVYNGDYDKESLTWKLNSVAMELTTIDETGKENVVAIEQLTDKELVIYGMTYSKLTNEEEQGQKDEYPEPNPDIVSTTAMEVIDLGLNVNWASCNIGATKPEEYGGLYGWADPTGMLTSTNTNDYPNATPPTDISGTRYDIVTVNFGTDWRMPTATEFKELIEKCSYKKETVNGVTGYRFTGPNGSSIFLPCAGYRYGSAAAMGIGTSGNYWTATCENIDEQYAGFIYLGKRGLPSSYNTCYGASVRAVTKLPATHNEEQGNGNRGSVAKTFKGSGTESDPYIISNASELRKLSDDVESGMTYRNEFFKMTADVTVNRNVLTEDGSLNGNGSNFEQWKPIGKEKTPFCGTFDGNGHSISGIYINGKDEDVYLGLFGLLSGTVTSVTIKDSYIKGGEKSYCGGVAGYMDYYDAGTASSGWYNPRITNTKSYAFVSGYWAGGIAGRCYGSKSNIDRCANYGDIEGHNVSGIAYLQYGSIENSVNYGKVNNTIKGWSGGISSCITGTSEKVKNCANFGSIVGNSAKGCGIAVSATIENCVNYGKVTAGAPDNYGIGNGGKITNCYYLETSCSDGSYDATVKNCVSMTAKQMQQQAFLDELNKNSRTLGSTYSQWKFGKDGLPTLEWIEE